MLQKKVLCKYPIPFLQDMLHGIMSGDFVMIAAGTGGGKSSVSRMLTQNAVYEGCPVVLYSLEDEQQTYATDSVYREAVKNGCKLDFREWMLENTECPEKYRECAIRAAEKDMKKNEDGLPLLVVHEMQGKNNWNVGTIVKSMLAEYEQGYRLFILDHLDVLVPSELPADMVRAINLLWRLVSEKQIALVTFSQLASRRNKEALCPSLDYIRGSKAKVQTPTVVISLARHNFGVYSWDKNPEASPTYIRVIKNRQGGKLGCSVSYYWHGHYVPYYINVDTDESGCIIDGQTMASLRKKIGKKELQ